jgi:DNA-binding SARP family transcriptional activator
LRSLLVLRSFSAAALMLAALAVLWRFRPERPDLPDSLSSPVTTAMLQHLVFIVAWLLGALVILLVLANSLRLLLACSRRQPPRALLAGAMPVARHRSLRRLAAGSSERAFSPPFPLIPRARPAPNGDHTRVAVREGMPAAVPPTESLKTDAREPRHGPRPPSIALLGPLTIVAAKPRRRGFRSHTQQLLAYLAFHREGATPDETIAALWPDVEDQKARKRLWDAVSDARAHLGECILRANERYLLDREAVAVDLDQFEELLARAHSGRGADREQLLERALALVRGQPLAGTDYAWAAGDMRRLHAAIVDLLSELGNLRLDNGNPTGALAAAEQAIALDPYNEAAHQVAMHAESVLGLRQAIVGRYERLCQELDTRFGLEPEHETRVLYRRLLSQDGREALRHLSPAPASPEGVRR